MTEKISLIVSAGLAVLGWLLTHYVDRLTEAATIEYSIRAQVCDLAPTPAGLTCVYRYRITNLNRTTAFNELRFEFLAEGAQITGFLVDPVEPANEGDTEPRITASSVTFLLPKLMPGAAIVMQVRAIGGRPIMSVRSRDTIRMSPPNLETFLARHEMEIMIGLVVVWILVLVILLLKGNGGSKGPRPLERHLLLFEEPAAEPEQRR